MARRALAAGRAMTDESARLRGPDVERREIAKPWVAPGEGAGERLGDARRALAHPVARAEDRGAAHPARLGIPHDIAPSACSIEHVIVHLHALDTIEEAEGRARVRQEKEGVVYEAIAPVRLACAVAAEASGIGGRLGLPEDVSDHIRVFPSEALIRSVGADELDLVIHRALDPVIIDFIPLCARLDVVPTLAVVHKTMLHPEHGAWIGDLI